MIKSLVLINTNYASNPIKLIGVQRPPGVASPAVRPQLGLASLLAYLKTNSDIQVSLVDSVQKNLTPEKTVEYALKSNPGAIGASSTYHNLNEALGILKKAKIENPSIATILGGAGSRSLFDLTKGKEINGLDYCVIGDGEVALHNILGKGDLPQKTQYIHGFVKDPNTLPSPYDIDPETGKPFLDCLNVEGYFEANRKLGYHGRDTNGKVLTVYASKGCTHNCAFCSAKTPWRGRNPEKLKSDLNSIKANYGSDMHEVFLFDDNPTSGPDYWLRKVCSALGDSGLPWTTEARADEILKKCGGKLPEILAKSGCKSVHIGAESGSQKVLDLLDKGITPKQTLDAIKALTNAEVKTNLLLMINCPEEGKPELDETLDLARKAIATGGIDSILAFGYVCMPGSRAYREGLHGGNLSPNEIMDFRNELLKIGGDKATVVLGTYK